MSEASRGAPGLPPRLLGRLDAAVSAAREAGEETLRWFGAREIGLRTKENGTPVTAADLAAEQVLLARLLAAFPDDAVLAEESGARPGTSGYEWILDPIDGTKSFARSVPLYGTLVGLAHAGRPVVGVAYFPALGEMVYAGRGLGAHWVTGIGGRAPEVRRPAAASAIDRWEDACFCFTSLSGFDRAGLRPVLDRFLARAGLSRGWSDCYGHMLVATGRAEAMLDPRLAPWDCAALLPILEEAGGGFTDLAGTATHLGGSGLSCNGPLLREALAICR